MTDTEDLRARGVDISRPSVARMYDYYLGGKDHFPADREAAQQAIQTYPEVPALARANRAFLGRAVRHLTAERGIRQFIDIGTGVPTAGSVHEIAHQHAPGARVVYVDNDPVVIAHARALLENMGNQETVTVIDADMRDPGSVLDHAEVHRTIDFTQPAGVLFASVLHFVSSDPAEIVGAYHDAVAPGSYLALSHLTYGTVDQQEVDEAADRVYGTTASGLVPRSPEQIREMFAGFELIEPGLTPVTEWRPDPVQETEPTRLQIIAGVGRKP